MDSEVKSPPVFVFFLYCYSFTLGSSAVISDTCLNKPKAQIKCKHNLQVASNYFSAEHVLIRCGLD